MDSITLIINTIGAAGLVLLLIGFYLEETGRAGKKHFYYNLLNAVGSSMLVVYAWYFETWIFVILNTIWVIIAFYYIFKH